MKELKMENQWIYGKRRKNSQWQLRYDQYALTHRNSPNHEQHHFNFKNIAVPDVQKKDGPGRHQSGAQKWHW